MAAQCLDCSIKCNLLKSLPGRSETGISVFINAFYVLDLEKAELNAVKLVALSSRSFF